MSLLSRWQLRKAQVAEEEAKEEAQSATAPAEAAPTDAPLDAAETAETPDGVPQAEAQEGTEAEALPDPDSIEEGGSFADFLKPGVDPSKRKEALRALWKQPHYNVRDGLCEYDLDYAAQPKLSAAVAAEVAKNVFRHVSEAVEEVDKAVARQAEASAEGETPSELPNVPGEEGQNVAASESDPDETKTET
ncbi:DUF3306 domain-containing protein [Ferrimonas balearica]|uniref:DUF3306 domain-containing protein n=1 Tax=Ferrimonas balearica TaxID=44012 RepID=UPI001C99A565|nr:DUF3306 domain-containing protein [Ferrimonas balearica]MBY5993250.1 DUF3306 domain-containing protein [Ferrimonas balearica]